MNQEALPRIKSNFPIVKKLPITEISDKDIKCEFVLIHSQTSIAVLQIKDILYCKANSNYTQIVLSSGKEIISSKSLKYYDNLLHTQKFIRCHASYLVNAMKITNIKTGSKWLVELEKHTIPVSKTRKKHLIAQLS